MKGIAVLVVLMITSAGMGSAQTDPKLAEAPDLVVRGIDFTSRGEVLVIVSNRGIAISRPFRMNVTRNQVSTSVEFVTIKAAAVGQKAQLLPFPANSERKIVVPEINAPMCAGNQSVKVILDPLNGVPEAYEDNNQLDRQGAAPCPDLAYQGSVRKNWNNLRTQYVAEVTVINQGTGDTGQFDINQYCPVDVTGIPWADVKPMDNIPPGRTARVTCGVGQIGEGMSVEMLLDLGDFVKESNESNNFLKAKLDR